MMWRAVILSKVVAVLLPLLLAAGFALAQEVWDEAAAVEVNTELNRPELIEKGRYLAVLGDCRACHTAPGGSLYAGGRAMEIPKLGTVYTSNITPDIHTGIGAWKLEEFEQALRHGIGRDGRNLYPAMPYDAYSKITDEDIRALYAYFLFGVAAVHEKPPENKIRRTMSPRWPLKVWNFLFVPDEPFAPDPQQSATWNRGAYLVQGLAHCGECHSPRGIAFQDKAYDETEKGFLGGGPVLDGWQAYNITPDPDNGIGLWTEAQLIQYLTTGHVNRLAQAGGTMAEAIENSFSQWQDEDIAAIVTYLRSIPPVRGRERIPRQRRGNPATDVVIKRGNLIRRDAEPQNLKATSDGARLYLGLCATCHGVDGTGSRDGYYPSLVYNSTVGARSNHNLRQVILEGVHRETAGEVKMMPSFARHLSKTELEKLLEYLRRQFAAHPEQGSVPRDN